MNTDLEYAIKSAVSDIIGAAPDATDNPADMMITPTSAVALRRLLLAATAVLVVAVGVTGIALAGRGQGGTGPAAAEQPVAIPVTDPASEPTAPTTTTISPASGEASAGRGESAGAPLAYSEQPLSMFPVGVEWVFRVPLPAELRAVSERAYVEWHRRIQACMRERGFNYVPPEPVDVAISVFARVLNPLNEEAARTWGYHVPESPIPVDSNAVAREDEEFAIALDGTETDPQAGCAAAAWEDSMEIVGDVGVESDALLSDLLERFAEYQSTVAHVETQAAWRSCMAERGHPVTERNELFGTYRELPSITEDELRTREADLSCDREVRLTENQSVWEAGVFEQWNNDTAAQWGEVQRRLHPASSELSTKESEEL